MSAFDVYRLRVTLKETEPPVWREVEVPSNLTLGALHFALQYAFGWKRHWLFYFETSAGRYGFPLRRADEEGDDLPAVDDAMSVTVAEAIGQGGSILYVYHPEHFWPHVVELIGTGEPSLGGNYPGVVDGKLAAPPDDAPGGVEYYTRIMEALDDTGLLPDDALAYRDWDPHDYDLDVSIPRPQALEAMAAQASRPHVKVDGVGDEFQGHATRTATRDTSAPKDQ